MAAREALQRAGVWDAVRPRLVLGENIAQALQFVRTGNADAGIVALGLVVAPGRPHRAGRPDAARAAPAGRRGAARQRPARAMPRAFLDARHRRRRGRRSCGATASSRRRAVSAWTGSTRSRCRCASPPRHAAGALLGRALRLAARAGRFPGRDLLGVLVLLPMVLPPTVLGYYLLLLIGRGGPVGRRPRRLGWGGSSSPRPRSSRRFVAAFPFLVRAAQAGFEQVDPSTRRPRARWAARGGDLPHRHRAARLARRSLAGWRSASRAPSASSARR
jgi:hypothetical protein